MRTLIAALLRDGIAETEVPDDGDAARRFPGVFIEEVGETIGCVGAGTCLSSILTSRCC